MVLDFAPPQIVPGGVTKGKRDTMPEDPEQQAKIVQFGRSVVTI